MPCFDPGQIIVQMIFENIKAQMRMLCVQIMAVSDGGRFASNHKFGWTGMAPVLGAFSF